MQIICDTSITHFRNIILGARHYAFTHTHILLDDRWLLQDQSGLRSMVEEEGIHGIIAQVRDRRFEQRLLELDIPVVTVTNSLPNPRLSMAKQDDVAIGRVAADHLLGRHCTAYACWGQTQAPYSRDNLLGFRSRLREHGLDCVIGESPSVLKESGLALIRRMQTWLRELPRPLGVFAVLDTYGLHLMKAARRLGWQIPGDMAVLGVGDDEFWTDFEVTPLSSIKLPSRQTGYESARLLDDLCCGRIRRPYTRLLSDAVYEMAPRKSTDIVFVKDPVVVKAVGYIREHALEDIYVGDVMKAAGVSRPALQKRFKAAIGCSILKEIQRERIARVKLLLRTTDMKLPAIAEACRFLSLPRLHSLFRKFTGQTPGQYRNIFRRMALG
ncbi:AraC family transcriptional regulator [Opitutaceae bacterium TAV5]|nr:AraC family transcriptional regulator [Opitutaceae bacterium TAV5]